MRPLFCNAAEHSHFAKRLLVRHVANAASIQKHDIGLRLVRDLLIAVRDERMRDLLRVAFVHLATVSLDKKFRHDRAKIIHGQAAFATPDDSVGCQFALFEQETIDLLEKRARFIASRFCPLLITLKHDTLSFTFPEVARQMRLLIERQIQKIASEIPPEWNWAELLSAVESNRDFHRLSPTQQDGARSKVRTWTPIHVEALLREFAFNLSGLKTDAFTELTSNSSERCGFQTMARPTNCRRGCVNYRFAQSTIFLRPRQRHG